MPLTRAALVSLLLLLLGCGPRDITTPAHDGGKAGAARTEAVHATSDAGPLDSAVGHSRVPARHRPAGSWCPTKRGPGGVPEWCHPDAGLSSGCVQDSDCSRGTRGRCLSASPVPCAFGCFYDTCASDSDCGADRACECRPSASSPLPNWCVTSSNCRVDADCGTGGYCSPSLRCNGSLDSGSLPGCVGYFCHTPQDSCTDDSDCTGDDTCNYDGANKRWSCGYIAPLG
jgi:hypothetical protein